MRKSFIHKNGNRRYMFLVWGREEPYFVKEQSDLNGKYTKDDIINVLELLFDNIVVVFGLNCFQQIVDIPISTNCAPLLADTHVYLYSCDAEFIKPLLSTGKKQWHLSSSMTHCPYIIYLVRYVSRWAWDQRHDIEQRFCFLLWFTPVDHEGWSTSHFPSRQTWRFLFHITKFTFLSSNIPSWPAYGVSNSIQGLLLLWMFYS